MIITHLFYSAILTNFLCQLAVISTQVYKSPVISTKVRQLATPITLLSVISNNYDYYILFLISNNYDCFLLPSN